MIARVWAAVRRFVGLEDASQALACQREHDAAVAHLEATTGAAVDAAAQAGIEEYYADLAESLREHREDRR